MERKNFINNIVSSGYRKKNGYITLSSCGGGLKTRKKIFKKSSLYKGKRENSKKFYHPYRKLRKHE